MSTMDPVEITATHWFPAREARLLGRGRINDTYQVQSEDGSWSVLQRLNTRVFADPVRCMEQTVRISTHLASRHPGWAPTLISTRDAAAYVVVDDAHLWRMWTFVEASLAVDELHSTEALQAAGHAFGHTQELLRDLAGPALEDPIPGLFTLAEHLAALAECQQTMERPLTEQEQTLITRARALQPIAGALSGRDGYIHGDCKPANLLFSAADPNQVTAVVDFDTTMRGHWAWDVGDLVRSAACSDQRFVLARVEPLLRGYLAGSPRRRGEAAEQFVLAPRYVAGCLAVRYLLDHLQGDRQFKVQRPGDNLRRAAERLALVDQLAAASQALSSCVTGLLRAR